MATEQYDLLLVLLEGVCVSSALFAKKIRSKKIDTPILVVRVGTADHREIVDSLDAGCDGYLENPTDSERLLAIYGSVAARK